MLWRCHRRLESSDVFDYEVSIDGRRAIVVNRLLYTTWYADKRVGVIAEKENT